MEINTCEQYILALLKNSQERCDSLEEENLRLNDAPFLVGHSSEATPIPFCKCAECKRDVEDDEDDDPCVIMKLDDLYAMQKDMIDLTDAIDLMAKYYVATKYQAPVNKQKYDDTVHNAKALAEEVFTRWENSTIEEIK